MTNKHDLFERIYNIENLFYAWKKAKYIYDTDMDFMYDTKELAEFEADLDKNLQKISEQIKSGKYRLKKLIPLWLPKVSTPKESRQNFYVSVEDQVVWIAVINVIGPILDDKMPYWSFGNRLYMPIWKENAGETDINGEPKKTAKFGYYSSASPKLYRNWSSSWPLFRKAVSISIKNMYSSAGPNIYEDIFSDEDQEDIENIGAAPDSFKIQYWTREYWHNKDNDNTVYYATIDFKKFYPSIDNKRLFEAIIDNLNLGEESNPLKLFIENLLDFHIDIKQFDNFNDENPELEISEKNGAFKAVPTGLFVAGFLANIAMMPVDLEVYKRIDGNHRIGHFRFVDDHVFLAYSFDELRAWIDEYTKIVESHLPSLEINTDKTEPELFREYIKSEQEADRKSDAMDSCRLDPHLPTPFTTLTLKKLSGISSNPFDLLDDADKKDLLKDIEHILVTEFPDNEIRSDTRVSWAASILIRLVPLLDNNIEELYNKRKNMEEVILTRDKLKEKVDKLIEQAREEKEVEYQELSEKAKEAEKAFNEYKEHDQKSLHKIYKHIFLLISKALKDNMAKPKLWKKCVDYCRITGFDGVPILLDILKVDNSLTMPGKQYLFDTVLASIIKNVFVSINIHKSNMFNDKEKYSANLFTANIKKLLGEFQRWPELHSKLSDKLLQQLSWAIDIFNIECNDPNRNIKFSNELLCMLWHYIIIYASNFGWCAQ